MDLKVRATSKYKNISSEETFIYQKKNNGS